MSSNPDLCYSSEKGKTYDSECKIKAQKINNNFSSEN